MKLQDQFVLPIFSANTMIYHSFNIYIQWRYWISFDQNISKSERMTKIWENILASKNFSFPPIASRNLRPGVSRNFFRSFFFKTIQPGSRVWQLRDLREHFFSILAWSITIINFSGHLWWASDRLLLWAVDFNLAAAFNWQILLLTPATDNKNQTNGQSLGNNQEPDSGIETESCVKNVPKCESSTCGC